MFRVSSSARAAIACAALAAALSACATSPDPTTTRPSPDLLQALPVPATPPTTLPPTPTAAPSTTKAKPAKPKPTTAKPPPRKRTATGAAAAGQAPAQNTANWTPVGGDEFDGSALNTAKWGTYDSIGAFGNGTRSPSAISQSGGSVHITATPGDGGVSGGMADAFGQTYGRWEFRARVDFGRGFGMAILLWPDSEKLSDGEIDIVEVPFEKRDNANFILHSGPDGSDIVGGDLRGDFAQWHTFAVEWLPDRITWYVDGVQRYKVTNRAIIPTQPMHLAIQLDQGPVKDWILAPDETTPAEIDLDVDWVRVYAPAKPAAAKPPASPTTAPPA